MPADRVLTRRRALRLVAGGLLAIPAGLLAVPAGLRLIEPTGSWLIEPAGLRPIEPAAAASAWHRSAPDVRLEGTLVRIEVSVPDEFRHLVDGPTWLHFNLPAQVDRETVWVDAGLNDLGYAVAYSTTHRPGKRVKRFGVNFAAGVPIKGNAMVPIRCRVTPAGGPTVEHTGDDARHGTDLNFIVSGSR